MKAKYESFNRTGLKNQLKPFVMKFKAAKPSVDYLAFGLEYAPGIESTSFYQEVQSVQALDASCLKAGSLTILLIAKIAAKAPMLRTVSITDNKLGRNFALEAAKAFAQSDSIIKVDISNNGLGKDKKDIISVFNDHNLYIKDMIKELLDADIPLMNDLKDIVGEYANHHIEFSI
jgi:hypothetical protein